MSRSTLFSASVGHWGKQRQGEGKGTILAGMPADASVEVEGVHGCGQVGGPLEEAPCVTMAAHAIICPCRASSHRSRISGLNRTLFIQLGNRRKEITFCV